MDAIFEVHMLNDQGKKRAQDIAESFDALLGALQAIWIPASNYTLGGREQAIVRTKLEEACFFAKKAMAIQKENQA